MLCLRMLGLRLVVHSVAQVGLVLPLRCHVHWLVGLVMCVGWVRLVVCLEVG